MKMKIIKNIFMFFMYFVYSILVLLFLDIINIDISKFNNIEKNIYLIITDLIYLIFVIVMYKKELYEELKRFKNNYKELIPKYLPLYILGLMLMSVSNLIITKLIGVDLSNNEIAVREYIKIFPFYMIFSTVIYAPIVEEITFRKTFKNIISNKWFYIVVSGVMFGVIHITGNNIGINDYLLSIPYILMGMVFAYIYYDSNNIFTTISIHSMHNLILLILQFIGG